MKSMRSMKNMKAGRVQRNLRTNLRKSARAIFRIESLLLFCLLATAVQCQKAEMKTSPVVGIWVEESQRADTIEFLPEYDGQDPIFWLKRGFRITEGYKLPDYFSGP